MTLNLASNNSNPSSSKPVDTIVAKVLKINDTNLFIAEESSPDYFEKCYIFWSSVRHTFPSTPGVFFPWLLVTRLTVKHLAANQLVRRRCRVFTLPRFPSRSALAIPIWSRRTRLPMTGHFKSDQLGWGLAEEAPVKVTFAVICVSSQSRFSKFSYHLTPVRSGLPFRSGDISTRIFFITKRHSLSRTSFTSRAIGFSYDWLSFSCFQDQGFYWLTTFPLKSTLT